MTPHTNKLLSAARIENSLGFVMLFGALLSAAIVLLGGVLYLWQEGKAPISYNVFHGAPAELCTIHGILRVARHLSGPGIIQLGLMLLVAVQLLRLVLTGLLFLLGRDRAFVLITFCVLGMLLYGLFLR